MVWINCKNEAIFSSMWWSASTQKHFLIINFKNIKPNIFRSPPFQYISDKNAGKHLSSQICQACVTYWDLHGEAESNDVWQLCNVFLQFGAYCFVAVSNILCRNSVFMGMTSNTHDRTILVARPMDFPKDAHWSHVWPIGEREWICNIVSPTQNFDIKFSLTLQFVLVIHINHSSE